MQVEEGNDMLHQVATVLVAFDEARIASRLDFYHFVMVRHDLFIVWLLLFIC